MGDDCTCGASAAVIRFPIERILEDPPPRGYCTNCGVEMAWPNSAAWPEACVNGCSPLVIQSFPPEPNVFQWGIRQGPPRFDIDTGGV